MFCYIVLSCVLLGPVFSQTSLSAADKQTILDEHNRLRGMVNPPAANMQRMAWNDELAQVAQNYVDACNFAYNPNRVSQQSTFTSVGENLYATNLMADYAISIMSWYNEVSNYNFSSNNCSSICRHYTQVVWATTNSVGCGTTRCANLTGVPNGANWLFFVCNYGPSGNIVGQRPYLAGSSCSLCPSDRSSCVSNTCAISSNTGTTEAANTVTRAFTMGTSSDALLKPMYLLIVFTALLSACSL